MISQTLALFLGLFQRLISNKVDDFSHLGFRPGKCPLPLNKMIVMLSFYLEAELQAKLHIPLGSPIPLTKSTPLCSLSRTKIH
jgi:hypothetical protein